MKRKLSELRIGDAFRYGENVSLVTDIIVRRDGYVNVFFQDLGPEHEMIGESDETIETVPLFPDETEVTIRNV